jgi:hypothetical protein
MTEEVKDKPKLKRGHLAVLDKQTGEVMTRFIAREVRMRNGRYSAIKSGVAFMTLREEAGEIAVWGSGRNKVAMVTSEGYRTANAICQITVRTPDYVEVPGVGRVPNPYIVVDEHTGAFKAGYWRKVALGPGLTGNPVIVDRCTYLDLHSYLMEDLINLRTRAPYAVINGVADVPPASRIRKLLVKHNEELMESIEAFEQKSGKQSYLRDQLASDKSIAEAVESAEDGMWRFMELEPTTGFGIWIDTQAAAVAKVFRTYAQTKKFGSRRLEAIAYRNVMRDHPLAPRMKVPLDHLSGEKGQHLGGVRCYFHEFLQNDADIDRLLTEFQRGAALAGLLVDSSEQPLAADTESVTVEQGTEGEGDVILDADGERQADPKAQLLHKIRTAEQAIGSKDTLDALRAKHDKIAEQPLTASTEELESYLAELGAAIDTEANDAQ